MATPYRNAALTNTAVLVKGAPCEVAGWQNFNIAAADAWLHLYDAATAGAVTVGTTTPDYSILIPAGSGVLYGGNTDDLQDPLRFESGLVIAATAGPTNGTAPTSTVVVNLRGGF